MRLGIDFGTTRTIAAHVDRGNYPVVSFLDNEGDSHDYIPTVAGLDEDRLVYGFDALDANHARGVQLVRSFKRELASPAVTSDSTVTIGGLEIPLLDLMTGFLSHVKDRLHTASSLSEPLRTDPLNHVAIAVPAHAHGAQRFLTLEAYRRAGFNVVAMINEPSAAGFEYTHRQGGTLNARRTRVLVYDLGGGTFDASLVRVDGLAHEILGTRGINRLGGDDFDAVLAACALEAAGTSIERLGVDEYAELLLSARDAKEGLAPQSRRMLLTVAGKDVVVRVDDFYKAATPLIEQTIDAISRLVGGLDDSALADSDVAGVYLVGGASTLPIVARQLREHFGRRVHRSPMPAGSAAVGLAIALDPEAGYSLEDRLSRGVGVFRERDGGAGVTFDPVLSPDNRLPEDGEVRISRRYRAAHNLAWYRFIEYSLLEEGQPRGDIAPLGEILFPVDPSLRDGRELSLVSVERSGNGGGPEIEEMYTVDSTGLVRVSVRDLETGYLVEAGFGG
ncbi:MAG TPA: Hsp70 family protein [Actinomycetaceae bacterium]|nr:Hsp70 family protein [Actinomycetaceae bacterium]